MSQDQRYIEIDGRRWRRADPAIPDALKKELVSELMSARRAVKQAMDSADAEALSHARSRVNDAKIALGERGQPWWERPTDDRLQARLAATIRTLLRKRGPDKTICPSDAARVVGGDDWRGAMDLVRSTAEELADAGWLEFLEEGRPCPSSRQRAIRLRMRD